MQTVCSTGLKGAPLATRPSRASLLPPRSAARGVVVCKAQARPALATLATLPALLAAHPAFAVVDQRLGGEGTGKALGVDTVEFFPIVIVFGIVWAFFYSAGKDLDKGGRGSGEDSGLSL